MSITNLFVGMVSETKSREGLSLEHICCRLVITMLITRRLSKLGLLLLKILIVCLRRLMYCALLLRKLLHSSWVRILPILWRCIWPMQAKTAVLDVFAILVIITARYKLISIKYG